MNTYRMKAKEKGWKHFSAVLPPEVWEKVKYYKKSLMAEYKKAERDRRHREEWERSKLQTEEWIKRNPFKRSV